MAGLVKYNSFDKEGRPQNSRGHRKNGLWWPLRRPVPYSTNNPRVQIKSYTCIYSEWWRRGGESSAAHQRHLQTGVVLLQDKEVALM